MQLQVAYQEVAVNPRYEAHRLICAHRVNVSAKEERATVSRPALLEEIAPTSMVLSINWPLGRGVDLTIDCGSCKFKGTVSHCMSWAEGYLVELGLNFDSVWSPGEFVPDGLFNPKCLVCREPGCIPSCVRPPCVGN